jgi:hypothetical protein
MPDRHHLYIGKARVILAIMEDKDSRRFAIEGKAAETSVIIGFVVRAGHQIDMRDIVFELAVGHVAVACQGRDDRKAKYDGGWQYVGEAKGKLPGGHGRLLRLAGGSCLTP